MSIKVLLAMLAAIRKRLTEGSRIRLVGAVSSFASMMQMISDFKPEVLLLDLHLPEERHFTPEMNKPRLAASVALFDIRSSGVSVGEQPFGNFKAYVFGCVKQIRASL